MIGIPNDYGVLDITNFTTNDDEIFIISEADLPYALLKKKPKKFKMKSHQKTVLIQKLLKQNLSISDEELNPSSQEEEESESDSSSASSDDEEEESEEEWEDSEHSQNKEKKTKKQLKKEEKERKIKAKQEKENKKAQGIISLFKSKVDDTKRSNSISEELDLSDIKKVKKSPREEAKKKAEHEFKKQKDEKGNLFKQSLNKEKS